MAGPEDYSPQDLAQAFSTALGKPVKLETHPLEAMVPTFTAAGFSPDLARIFREMIEGINSGHVAYEGRGATLQRGEVTALEAITQMLGRSAATLSGGGRAWKFSRSASWNWRLGRRAYRAAPCDPKPAKKASPSRWGSVPRWPHEAAPDLQSTPR